MKVDGSGSFGGKLGGYGLHRSAALESQEIMSERKNVSDFALHFTVP